MAASAPREVTGLEVWLIGTPAELDVAVAALGVVGRVMQPVDEHGKPDREAFQRHELAGLDAPRCRQYLRLQLHMITAVSAAAPVPAEVDMGLLAGAA